MEEFEQYYPPKPILEKQKGKKHISITILSILLFAMTFSLIIDDYFIIGMLLLVLLVHELGHFSMMKLFRYKDMNMLFIPFIGAMVSGQKKKYSQKEVAIMVLAGPLPGIIIGATLLKYQWILPEEISIQLGVLFILLNVLNLIPFEPLDGGQLVRSLFFYNKSKYELFQIVISVTTSLGVALIGLYFNSWLVIIIGLLMGIRIKSKLKRYLIHKELTKNEVNYEVNYEDISDRTYNVAKKIIINHTPALEKLKEYEEHNEYDQLVARQVDGVLDSPMKRDAPIWFKIVMMLLMGGGIWLSIYSITMLDLNTILDAFQFE